MSTQWLRVVITADCQDCPDPCHTVGKGSTGCTRDEASEPSARRKNLKVSVVKEGFYEGQTVPKESFQLLYGALAEPVSSSTRE